jgi:hypothetical protein
MPRLVPSSSRVESALLPSRRKEQLPGTRLWQPLPRRAHGRARSVRCRRAYRPESPDRRTARSRDPPWGASSRAGSVQRLRPSASSMQARSDAYQHASSRVSHFARTRVRQDWHSPQRADHRSSELPTSSCETALTADDPHAGHRRNRAAPDGLKSTTHRRCAQARAPRLQAPARRRQQERHRDMQRGQHGPPRAASVEGG